MGFFQRFFKKVEEVNNQEAAASELESELYVESPEEEAMNLWVEIAQNILVNSVRATGNSVDRAFVLVEMREQPSFDIFYQKDGDLVMWYELEDPAIKERIENELLPQAPSVASAVNGNFAEIGQPEITFAQLQFEWATKAWFSHIIREDDAHAKLAKDEVLHNWFNNLSTEIKTQQLDSDTKLSWYP
ncbi:hypothetical protein J9317_03930 [Metabacillus sp. KIGAM252]|uniref:Uncharacterized protein n=1 Tax=Metabacillus flavus TaxID=2823519 RepID=A0ABS5LBK0_9BACI|nr:hypothetical protein [Metabacillus flavus]MBS2967923.1 hypothetical protein [Metabacillus flavus]